MDESRTRVCQADSPLASSRTSKNSLEVFRQGCPNDSGKRPDQDAGRSVMSLPSMGGGFPTRAPPVITKCLDSNRPPLYIKNNDLCMTGGRRFSGAAARPPAHRAGALECRLILDQLHPDFLPAMIRPALDWQAQASYSDIHYHAAEGICPHCHQPPGKTQRLPAGNRGTTDRRLPSLPTATTPSAPSSSPAKG